MTDDIGVSSNVLYGWRKKYAPDKEKIKYATLEELSDEILDVFESFNDHAHAFFMNNRAWMETDCPMSNSLTRITNTVIHAITR